MGIVKHSQSSQSSKFAMSLQYLKKEVKSGVHFLYVDKSHIFYKLALLVVTEGARHVQNTQNRKLVIFLQYLREKILMKFIFCMQIDMKISYKLILTSWMSLAKRNFTRVIKYFSVATAFVFYCDVKHSDILQGPSHVCCYLF